MDEQRRQYIQAIRAKWRGRPDEPTVVTEKEFAALFDLSLVQLLLKRRARKTPDTMAGCDCPCQMVNFKHSDGIPYYTGILSYQLGGKTYYTLEAAEIWPLMQVAESVNCSRCTVRA